MGKKRRASGKKQPVKKRESGRPWKIACDAETFAALRENEAFHRLLDLARHVNALRYGIAAVAAVGGRDTPNAARQRSCTFFYHGGILFEAFQLIARLRPHFEHLEAWSNGFAEFGTDEEVRNRLERGGDLHTLRNHTSFHVLHIVAPKSLEALHMDEYVFTSGQGSTSGEVYHFLADTVPLHYVIGAPKDGADFQREFERIATETRDLAIQFIKAAEKLIGPALKEFGFKASYIDG